MILKNPAFIRKISDQDDYNPLEDDMDDEVKSQNSFIFAIVPQKGHGISRNCKESISYLCIIFCL